MRLIISVMLRSFFFPCWKRLEVISSLVPFRYIIIDSKPEQWLFTQEPDENGGHEKNAEMLLIIQLSNTSNGSFFNFV